MKTICIERADGGVSIMTIIRDDADVAQEVARWETGSGLTAVSFREIDPSEVPADRSRRHQWTLRGGRIEIDPTRQKPEIPTA